MHLHSYLLYHKLEIYKGEGIMTFNFFKPEGNFINGQWVVPEDNQWRNVVDPSTQRTIGEIPMSTSRDVETAIKYASESFESGVWSRATPSLRGRVLWSLASLIEANLTEIAIVEAQDSGKPIREAEADIAGVVDVFQYFAGLASKVVGQTWSSSSRTSGRRRRNHALEFSHVCCCLESGGGSCSRVFCRAQTI